MPQGLPSTSALSRHAIYQSFYLRSGAATPIAPPAAAYHGAATGAPRRLRLSVSRLRVSVPARCGVWTTRKCRRYCIHLMSPSTQTPTPCRQEWDRSAATPALARRLAQINKDLRSVRSRCCAARHASDRRSHPRTVPCSPLEGSAALYARRLRLSLMIVPLSQQAHARCGHAPFWARESTALRSLRQDVDKSISHHSRSHSRGGRDDHR